MKEKILITSALPYINNVPHMGNIIGCVLSADVFARYRRSKGDDVLYICGADESGTTTETKAAEEGLTPQELCDKYCVLHEEVYAWFNISFDIFGRTSAKNHHAITQEIFTDLEKNGYIVEKEVEQLFDEQEDKFLADRFVEGECPHCHYEHARGDQCESCGKLLDPQELKNPTSKLSGTKPVVKKSTHLYLDLPKLQPELQAWFEKQAAEGRWTQNALTTTAGWLKNGLEQRAITRDLKWGVPVPGHKDKVFYVWFDAPIGYISITEQLTADWKDWWQHEEVKLFQFMAKDNIPFHTILFPASLIGTGKPWTLLHHINVTEYLQHEDGKFSKSRGTGLFGDDAMRLGIPADVFRYYLLINRPEKADTMFTWKDLQEKLNNELLANLGNLVNRTLQFVAQYHDNTIIQVPLDQTSNNFYAWVVEEAKQVGHELDYAQEKEALRRVMDISHKANQYFQEQQPWKTRTENPEACQRAMFVLTSIIRDLAILIEPFLPATSVRIFEQLNLEPQPWRDLGDIEKLANHTIGKPAPLFQKLDDERLDEIRKKTKKQRTITVTVSEELTKKGLHVAAAHITGVKITNKNKELDEQKKQAAIAPNEQILAAYKALYPQGSFTPPAAYLQEFLEKEGKLPNINTVVDAYNLISATTCISMGAHDTKHLHGNLSFRTTTGKEKYTPLGEKKNTSVAPGEYACMDEEKIICRMDIKQCDETKITKNTKDFILYAQGNKELTPATTRAALERACTLITKVAGGTFTLLGGEEVKPLQIKTGTIVDVYRHPEADKLFVEQVDIGGEIKTIVSGLRGHITQEELRGKTALFVTNLAPANLRGIESEGMIVCAESGKELEVLFVDAPAGTLAVGDGTEEEITIDEFAQHKLTVKDNIPLVDGEQLKVGDVEVKTQKIANGTLR
ncbi:MAG: methionine--tRNA ligase [Candidatus Woesearchaeota archaeon]|nr:methionine--tRNA ligase [Candidatus Woesearchaeota archaeon]